MNLLSPAALTRLSIETVKAPRSTFARLMALDLDRTTLWQALMLTVAVSILLGEAMTYVLSSRMGEPMPRIVTPLTLAVIQGSFLIVTVFLIDFVGRMMGGTGRFADAILAMAWLNAVMIVLQVVQLVLAVALPPLFGLVVLVQVVLSLYLLTAFIAELHGFGSMARVFGMILFVLMGVALGLSFILTLSGVTVST